ADKGATQAFDRRLRQRLAKSAEPELGFGVGFSAGIAMRLAEDDTLEAMLSRADATLYQAKAQGRARTLDERGVMLGSTVLGSTLTGTAVHGAAVPDETALADATRKSLAPRAQAKAA
ncbi:MAG: hypothetical protein JWQ11_4041, partial [Rhizobacter sp.]|nr:hypothetical protein [Rhizobacter sp.]